MLSLFNKAKKTGNFLVFGSSGSGKSFSGIYGSLHRSTLYQSLSFKENLKKLNSDNNFYGYFITEEYIKETSFFLRISEDLFKIYLLILKKHNYNPIGRDIYIKNNIFFMDGLEINLRKYNDKYYLNQILNDFREDFDYMFPENLNRLSDIEKARYILNNYKDYYDEDLYFIETYCYNIYDNNFNKNISLGFFENDIEFFIKELNINNDEVFFKDLSSLFIKSIVFHFLKNETENIYEKISTLDNIYNLDIENNDYLKRLLEIPKEYVFLAKIEFEDAFKMHINQFF